jgi:two-component system, LytTR family, response regulator
MNCVIIEDEFAGQEILKIKLKTFFPAIHVLAVIDSLEKAIEFLQVNKAKIDFIFLDIHLKGGNGLQILNQLKDRNFDVIFTTAFENYALEAFKENAIHYLLKPFSDEDFQTAVNRIFEKRNIHGQQDFMYISTRNEEVKLAISDIFYLKSEGSYTDIFTKDRKFTSSKNLGEFEKLLQATIFVRVHHSFIINIQKIKSIEKGKNALVHLQNQTEIPISQRKMAALMSIIKTN